ncbi:unnamed protein product [Blepharisma stoltei]|uniref:Uncharacterized protein n=1 Tax=Blepharisma stoltei TaxID=1481888 RepID=A0AAU9JXN7_9CILI|nr:unnamed protein product [Blepharisma stoltei]
MGCFYLGCSNKIDCWCTCSSKVLPICFSHLLCHLNETSSNHHLAYYKEENFMKTQRENFEEINSKIEWICSQKSTLINKAKSDIMQIANTLNYNLSHLDHLKSQYLESLNLLNLEKECISFENEKNYNFSPYNFHPLLNSSKNDNINLQDLKIDHHQAKNILLNSYKSITKIKNRMGIQKHMEFSLCILPNNVLFAFRNHSYTLYPKIAFIMHNSKNIEIVRKGMHSKDSGISYLDGCIYLIGRGHRVKSYCEKYDLQTQRWKFLAPNKLQTSGCYDLNCTVFRNKILYTGSIEQAFIYDPILDNHTNILRFKYKWQNYFNSKVIFTIIDRAYIAISQGWVFESNVEDPFNWSIFMKKCELPKNQTPVLVLSTGAHSSMIYEDRSIYEFDLNRKAIEKIIISKKIDA